MERKKKNLIKKDKETNELSKLFRFPRRVLSIAVSVSKVEALSVGGVFGLFLFQPFSQWQFFVVSDSISHFLGQGDVMANFVHGIELVRVGADP